MIFFLGVLGLKVRRFIFRSAGIILIGLYYNSFRNDPLYLFVRLFFTADVAGKKLENGMIITKIQRKEIRTNSFKRNANNNVTI